jgi:hypothetical protein
MSPCEVLGVLVELRGAQGMLRQGERRKEAECLKI